jgi:glycoside/pentoside/hexuronide:cation symporter, GPH family
LAGESVKAQRRVPLLESWRVTLSQPDFRRLCCAQLFIYASVLVIDNTGFYLNVFLVNGGSMSAGAFLKGLYGTAFQVGGMLAIPFIVRLSNRIGKKQTFLLCTSSIAVAGVAKWFCYVPGAGLWLILPSALMAPGLVAVMVLVPSMTADICDLDAAGSGERREGMYNAVLAWTLKVAISGSIFLSGWVLALTGWRTPLNEMQSEGTFLAMRLVFAGGTVFFAALAALFIMKYSVTPERVAAAQRAQQGVSP